MSKLEIFESGGCCATSSVTIQPEAVALNADFEWAKRNGIDIHRYSLTKHPQRFVASATVQAFLNASGIQSLPIVLLDGAIVMAGRLPTRQDLGRWGNVYLSPSEEDDRNSSSCCNVPRIP